MDTFVSQLLRVIPGSETPVRSAMEARQFVAKFGTPVFMKPARGGGGRGLMRIDSIEEVENAFQRCSYEALKSFGDRSLYVEKFIDHPRVIQIQIMGDHYGDVIHLYDRDCSIQKGRRKVIEFAPAHNLDPKIRDHLLNDAIKLAKHVKYYSAGTVEFLVDIYGDYYFMEMNSELEAEHALTEEMTGLDLVQAQIQIAEGKRLKNIPHFQQEKISPIGAAIQCRITAEDPVRNFAPDEDMIELFRSGGGAGIRLDSPEAFSGSTIAICYDAALMKIVARSRTHEEAVRKMIRALREFRVRGIKRILL
ncbi:hypothetical protein AB6A40_010315 [Gnathostoma spinigerum]|uniref:Pyruvate carboxylase n=1 Tax=Gnathostoma spinigerum TaxID=75299 RepID=A0ABD6F0W5_9BILA